MRSLGILRVTLLPLPRSWLIKILETTNRLGQFPLSGRVVPKFADENIREKIVYSYRVIYRIQNNTITVATVVHGKKLL